MKHTRGSLPKFSTTLVRVLAFLALSTLCAAQLGSPNAARPSTPQNKPGQTSTSTLPDSDLGQFSPPHAPFLQEPFRNPSMGVDYNDNPSGNLLLHSGELILTRTDMETSGRKLGFRFTRTYRSGNDSDGPLGFGWDANVFMRLVEQPNGDVIRFDGAGREDRYVFLGGGQYRSPVGFYDRLVGDGNGFLIRNRDGLKHSFDSDGKIQSIQDRFGNQHDYSYDGMKRLERIVDEFGREVLFAYDLNDRLDTVTDFTNRVVQFTYDGQGNLVQARSPLVTGTPHGNDFPLGKREQYGYDTGQSDPQLVHNLLEVIFPNEVEDASFTPRIVNTYGQKGVTFDRVIAQQVGGTNASGSPAGGTLRFHYGFNPVNGPPGAASRTRIRDRNGNINDYYHDADGHLVQVIDDVGGATPFVTSFEYNQDGEITRKIQPLGSEWSYVYDEANPDRFQQGNLLELRQTPDGSRPGDQTAIVTTFTHEPVYNQFATVTEPRGNDPTYVPQNGGAQSSARYRTDYVYDWQEAASAPQEALDFGISVAGSLLNLGDVNLDGRTDQAMGNLLRLDAPTVTLLAGSEQATLEGDTTQEIVSRWTYNDFGQIVQFENARGNVSTFSYYPENDPDGDGLDIISGRDPLTGGYKSSEVEDALIGPNRLDTASITAISQTYQLDRRGNVIIHTDGRGLEYRCTYNALDQVIVEEDPKVDASMSTGYLRRNHFDANDNITRRDIQNWKADASGNQVLDPAHPFFEHDRVFDILDNLLEKTEDATRDAAIPPSSEPQSLVTRYGYDPNENLLSESSPLAVNGTDPNNVRQYAYDSRDLIVSHTLGAGSLEASTWTCTYDLNANRTAWTDAEDNDGDAGPETHSRGFDGFDRIKTETDRAGNQRVYTYDPDGRVIEEESSGPIDGSSMVLTPLERVITRFDEIGRLVQTDRDLFLPSGVTTTNSVTLNDGPLSPGDGRVSTRIEYDAIGRVTFSVEDDGAVYRSEFDGADREILSTQPLVDSGGVIPSSKAFTYDLNDNLTKRVETLVSPEGLVPPTQITIHRVFDAVNRLARSTDSKGSTRYSRYDSQDNLVSSFDARGALITDPLGLYTAGDINAPGNPVHNRYDGINRLWSRVQELHQGGQGDQPLDTSNPAIPSGRITQIVEHDANSRVVSRIDGNGNGAISAFDSLDRLTSKTNADGGVRSVTYDKDHHPVSVIDENGTTHTLNFDGLSRLTQHGLALSGTTIPGTTLPMLTGTTLRSFQYDGLSRLTRSFDNNDPGNPNDDWQVDTIFDSLSRCVEQDQNGRVISSSYSADRRTRLFYPGSGRQVNFTYDAHDQLIQAADTSRLSVTTNYLGDVSSPILREHTALNPAPVLALSSTRTLDGVLLPGSSQSTAAAVGLIAQETLTRNRNHEMGQQQITLQDGGANSMSLVFDWDLSSLDQILVHDRQRTINAVPSNTFYDFRYGPAQEILQVTDGVVPVQTNTFSDVYERTNAPFDYNASQASGTGIRTKDADHYYQWDGLNRLRTVALLTDPNNPITRYVYDAEPDIAGGRRVQKDVQGTIDFDGNTRFYYDRERVIEETLVVGMSESLARQYVHGYCSADDVTVMDVDTDANGSLDTLYFYGRDVNGNTTHLVDQTGNPAEFYAYDHLSAPEVFDSAMSSLASSTAGNPFLFTGRRYEPETGLYYFRSRYFDPANSEYLSRASSGFWASPMNDGNPMAYGSNDLWNVKSPSGGQSAVRRTKLGDAARDVDRSDAADPDPSPPARDNPKRNFLKGKKKRDAAKYGEKRRGSKAKKRPTDGKWPVFPDSERYLIWGPRVLEYRQPFYCGKQKWWREVWGQSAYGREQTPEEKAEDRAGYMFYLKALGGDENCYGDQTSRTWMFMIRSSPEEIVEAARRRHGYSSYWHLLPERVRSGKAVFSGRRSQRRAKANSVVSGVQSPAQPSYPPFLLGFLSPPYHSAFCCPQVDDVTLYFVVPPTFLAYEPEFDR